MVAVPLPGFTLVNLVPPSEWEIRVTCDEKWERCRMEYVGRIGAEVVRGMGLSVEELVRACMQALRMLEEEFGDKGVMDVDIRVEGDSVVERIVMEGPLQVVATALASEFIPFSVLGVMPASYLVLGGIIFSGMQAAAVRSRLRELRDQHGGSSGAEEGSSEASGRGAGGAPGHN